MSARLEKSRWILLLRWRTPNGIQRNYTAFYRHHHHHHMGLSTFYLCTCHGKFHFKFCLHKLGTGTTRKLVKHYLWVYLLNVLALFTSLCKKEDYCHLHKWQHFFCRFPEQNRKAEGGRTFSLPFPALGPWCSSFLGFWTWIRTSVIGYPSFLAVACDGRPCDFFNPS